MYKLLKWTCAWVECRVVAPKAQNAMKWSGGRNNVGEAECGGVDAEAATSYSFTLIPADLCFRLQAIYVFIHDITASLRLHIF
jgi:hypothetical protein